MPNSPNTKPLQHFRAFPVAGGQCVIWPDRIEIRMKGWTGTLSRWLNTRGMERLSKRYNLIAALLALSAFVSLALSNVALSLFLLGLAGYYRWQRHRYEGISMATLIPRTAIREVVFVDAVPGISRAQTQILFESAGGRELRRLLPVPRSARPDDAGLIEQETLAALRAEGLLAEDQ